MTAALAIAQRELASFYRTPIGWVVVALYLLVSGVFVATDTLRPGEPATLRTFFGLSHWLLLSVAPAISMRLISEEHRTGTIEPLAAAPVSDYIIALGKYLGACLFLLTMLAPTLLYIALLEAVADPEPGPILAGYIGLILTGMLYLSAGLLFSSLTSSQVVAFLGTLFFFLLMTFASDRGAAMLGGAPGDLLRRLSISMRINDFARGILDAGHIAFFLCWSAWFVLLSGVVLETRRWR